MAEVDEGVGFSNAGKNLRFTMTGESEQHYSGNIIYSLFELVTLLICKIPIW